MVVVIADAVDGRALDRTHGVGTAAAARRHGVRTARGRARMRCMLRDTPRRRRFSLGTLRRSMAALHRWPRVTSVALVLVST
jgi:hypothetical protein